MIISKNCFSLFDKFSCFLLKVSTIVLLLPVFVAAQPNPEKGLPFIVNYSPKTFNGAPQVWSAQEDDRGIMYFGSQSCLLEYDGNKWTKINFNSTATGSVRAITKDKDGTIYLGTLGDLGYLAKDSLGQTKFQSLLHLILKENQNFFDIWTIYTTDKSIYFQSREYIFRLGDPKTSEPGKADVKVWKPQSKFMFAFYLDGEYFVHQQGLGLYKMTNDSLVLIPGSEYLGKERMQVMLPYFSGPNGEKQYLLGQFNNGLSIYNGRSFRPFPTKADEILKSGHLLYKGLRLKNGDYVLSLTGNGLVIIDSKGNLLQNINRSTGLQNESIYANYLDKKGALWLALDNGISRIEINSPLSQFTSQSGVNSGVLTTKRFDGNLYIGTSNGLFVYDSTRQIFNPVPGIAQSQVFALLIDSDKLLVGCDGLFAIKNKKAFTLHPSVSGDFSLASLYIPKKYPDLLLGGGTFGLGFFDRKKSTNVSGEKNPWNFKGLIPGITERIIIFSEDKDGTIWAGSFNGVAYRLSIFPDEKNNPDLTKIKIDTIKSDKDINNFVGGVTPINGTTYFQADSFLYVFDKNKKQFVVDTAFGMFPNGNVATDLLITEDQLGRVWINIDKQTKLAIPQKEGGYRIENAGLNSLADYSFGDIFSEKNGITWIATTDGLIRFDENLEKNTNQSFKTILRHITAGKTALSTDTPGGQKTFSISFKNNTLRFEYAAPFFEQEDKTLYQTWLEGFEDSWSGFDDNYYKEYTNLPAGKYHFHVRAKNVYQKLSEETVYAFTIKPPWYASWWAYTLYALAAAALIYLIVRYRTHQLHEKHRELEKTVSERTAELSQRVNELAVINSVQDGLVREMNIQGIYHLVGEKIRKIFDAQVVVIRTYDHENNLEKINYAIEKGELLNIQSRILDDFARHLIKIKKPLLLNQHFAEYLNQYSDEVVLEGEVPKSALFVPMISGDVVIGNISLQNVDHENAFTDSDVSLLTTLANSMSVALESARLFDETNRLLKETEQRTAELGIINSVQEGLASKLDIQAMYDFVGDKIRDVFDIQGIAISYYDRQSNYITHPYYRFKGKRIFQPGFELGKGLTSHIIQTGQPLLINENAAERFKELGAVFASSESETEEDTSKSWLGVPLISGGQVNGTICLENYEREFAYSEADVSLLQTLANSMSVALENARLFDETIRLLKETEQRKAELAVINSVQEGLVKEIDIQAIYDLVGNRVCELFDSQTVLIRTFNHESGTENWKYAIEKGKRQYSEPRPLIWANKQLIKTQKPILINENYVETARKYGGSGVSIGQPPKSAMFVPMIVGDIVRGSVSLQNVDREHAFSESDLRLLTTLSNSMGVALENARLFDETTRLLAESKQRASELSTVNNISHALASQLKLDELIKLVGDQMRDLFKANIVYVALLDQKTKIINFPYQFGENLPPMKLGEGLTSKILITGKPLLINKDVQELTTQLGVQNIGIPAASYLGVPIPVGDEIIGVLSIQSTEHENRFNENDQRLLSTIAASVGVALRKAKLFEEVHIARTDAESARKTAEQANAAKSAFLSTVSHELRTPLTSVLGFAKIIKKRLEEKIFPVTDKTDSKTGKTIQQISENLNVVISEGERLTNLINEVLDLAKIEAGKMEWNMESVSMPEILERAIAATTSLFDQKNLELKKYIEDDLPVISGDGDKLIQVIVNLISNAVKFTPKGTVTCSIKRKKNEIITGISDTGIGIAPEDHEVVFEQFKQVVGDTLTDKPKGTGLGLPICKEIVEHHGGRIWLESEFGKGSTFFFALPVQVTDAPKPVHLNKLIKQLKEQMAHSKLNIKGINATILIVDDDNSIRSLLHQELSDAGYIIEEATNGKEALAKIRNHRPDLIILDVMMPEMNGFDVAAILKNDPQTMDIPIIVLSIVQDKARGYRIGVDRYLTKPINTVQLFAEVENLLEQGKSRKKVMVVDEDSAAVRSLTDVLHAKGYQVVESDGKELVAKAIASQPDIIILNSVFSAKQEIVQTLRFEKGLENVLFLIYQ